MNTIFQKKPLGICLLLLSVLMACQVGFTQSPTSTTVAGPASAPPPRAVATQISTQDKMVLVYVPEGEFRMGSTDEEIEAIYNECYDDMAMPCQSEWFEDELPAHNVYLDAFWIDQTEVTNGQYRMCVEAGGCGPLMSDESYTRDSYFGDSAYDNFPVVYVEWPMANAYCQWAGRRLPTEAEWEKAARGTDGRMFPWGNELPDAGLLNFSYGHADTTEVGSYPAGASPYGAVDMAGNVSEWTADWYDDGYYGNSPKENPSGPANGEQRVMRGGDYSSQTYSPNSIRSTSRSEDQPIKPIFRFYLGFRCASSDALQTTADVQTRDDS